MEATKVRTNIYLYQDIKEEAKNLFKSYGLSFSDGINFLLKEIVDKKELNLEMDIEPILPNEPYYEIAKNAYDNYKKYPEGYVDFDKWKKSLNV